ncbi:MAG: DUF4301 family protein [Bacteroidetes bacterium]|nr:DUF4301 family protein [Bacteroidota bacterium]
MFTQKDIQQIKNNGLTVEKVEKQIQNFKDGFPFLQLVKPATIGDGIIKLQNSEVDAYSKLFDDINPENLKFVPASGAASRMFKFLFEFYDSAKDKYNSLEEIEDKEVEKFFSEIEKFAFYKDLRDILKSKDLEITDLINQGRYKEILKYFLFEEGLNYGQKPKGVLMFHKYADEIRTAFEEHLVEGARYAKSPENKVKIHFTISPEHEQLFKELVSKRALEVEKKYNVKFEITFSQQKPSTDMVAVDLNNELFRNEDDSLLFRPGGHGALIENLNDLDSEIIFIKNIDNVVPDNLKDITVSYKKALAGLLIAVQEKIFNYIEKIEFNDVTDELVSEIVQFISSDLCFEFNTDQISRETILNILKRPTRVCGMVKNEGEPGGGPFWVKDQNGSVQLQIVETSQISSEPDQQEILQKATHFNPVDLVCATKERTGENYDLLNFIDPTTGFISKKSKDGKDLKAQELPGLWNGAMANWNTIFVEVPIETFNPVKTVNDLLRPQHQ